MCIFVYTHIHTRIEAYLFGNEIIDSGYKLLITADAGQ